VNAVPADTLDFVPREPMPRRSPDALLQMIENVDETHDNAHKRLRGDFEELKREMTRALNALRDDIHANKASITELRNAPLDATKLMLTSKVVVALVIMALGIAASVWSIRSGMDQMASRMETATKLQDVQYAAIKTSVDEMRRRQELQQFELQSLKEAILVGNKTNGRK
jgi:hypothetical protein